MERTCLLLTLFMATTVVQAQVVRHVSINGNDQGAANTCFDPEQPCRTIHQALSVSSSGDTIMIGGGVFTETLEIVRSMTIKGAGQGITIIQAHAQPFTAESGVVFIDGSGGNREVRISNMTIRHGVGGGANQGGGIHNNMARVILDSVTFFANSGRGGGFHNFEGDSELTDVTFTENRGDFGGGMYNRGADPSLTNVRFIDNHATSQGGGMQNEGVSSPVLSGVVFRGNKSENNGGGMTNTTSSEAVFDNVVFENNSAQNHGGGLRNSSSSHSIFSHVVFSGNSAGLDGGAISNSFASSPVFNEVTFTGNTSGRNGGAVNNSSSSHPVLTSVVFRNNAAENSGGAFYNGDMSSATLLNAIMEDNTGSTMGGGILQNGRSRMNLVNSLLAGNTSGGEGGGIHNSASSQLVLINATISGNTAAGFGGGILNGSEVESDTSSVTLVNTILWNNVSVNIGNEFYHFSESSSSVHFDHVLYRDRDGAGDLVRGGSFTETGSVVDDPLFADAAAGNYRLQPESPAIDAGNPETDLRFFSTNDNNEPLDLDGKLRVLGEAIDLGPYEFMAEETSVADLIAERPWIIQLHQNYPNPFNPSTVIRYDLPEAMQVQLEVYDLLGRRVTTLVSALQQAGVHEAVFDASSLSGGAYMYRLSTGEFRQARAMMLVK
jgi:predicted outer membrane repeat protein